MSYSNNFPANCPPDTARECNSKVYRLISGNIPADEDFVPHRVKCPKKYRHYSNEKKCMACGLSVQGTLEGAKLARALIRAFRNKQIAGAELTPEHGMLSFQKGAGADAHRTWWPYDEVDKKSLFKLVDES